MSSIRFPISGWNTVFSLFECVFSCGMYKTFRLGSYNLILPSQSQGTQYSGCRHLQSPQRSTMKTFVLSLSGSREPGTRKYRRRPRWFLLIDPYLFGPSSIPAKTKTFCLFRGVLGVSSPVRSSPATAFSVFTGLYLTFTEVVNGKQVKTVSRVSIFSTNWLSRQLQDNLFVVRQIKGITFTIYRSIKNAIIQ